MRACSERLDCARTRQWCSWSYLRHYLSWRPMSVEGPCPMHLISLVAETLDYTNNDGNHQTPWYKIDNVGRRSTNSLALVRNSTPRCLRSSCTILRADTGSSRTESHKVRSVLFEGCSLPGFYLESPSTLSMPETRLYMCGTWVECAVVNNCLVPGKIVWSNHCSPLNY